MPEKDPEKDLELDDDLMDILDSVEEEESGEEVKSKPKKEVETIEATSDSDSTADDSGPSELQRVLDDFDSIKRDLLYSFQEDRDKIQNFVDYLEKELQSDPKSYYVEGISSLLSTKASISSNAIRVLDSIAKIVSASKNHPGISQSESPVSPKDLDKYLGKFDEEAP